MNKNILPILVFCALALNASAQFNTNLPIIKLTGSQPIVDSYQLFSMDIIDNTSGINTYTDAATQNTNAGVRLRGNAVSQAYPKKSYSVETWTGFNISNNISVLGLPAENDWVLLAAYPDRSLLRSMLALELHDQMDRYAPRFKFCELFIDTAYQGVYLFGEKIKRDTARLDLANLRTIDNFGEELTGGYILQLDDETGGGFTSAYTPPNATAGQQIKFLYEYPDNGDITPAQEDYIESYVDSFELALNGANYQDSLLGWRPFGANNAFADFIIMNEVSRNYDAYRTDMYLYKDKNKKMRPGPLWGFDASFANTQNCGSNGVSGYAYDIASNCGTLSKLPAFWWDKLMTDSDFAKDLRCRYTEYRKAGSQLDTTHIFMLIDGYTNQINQMGAGTRNFTKYPIFGTPIINEPTPLAADYATEISNLKSFIAARLNWLDGQWLESTCAPLSTSKYAKSNLIKIYPNPASNQFTIESLNKGKLNYHLRTISGKVLIQGTSDAEVTRVQLEKISAGVYFLFIDQDGERFMRKIIVE